MTPAPDPGSGSGPLGHDELAVIEAHNDRTFAAAEARTSFELTYGRAERRRRFVVDGIESVDDIDNARHGHDPHTSPMTSADWNNGGGVDLDSHGRLRCVGEQDWFDDFARSMVGEAVHESLEWLHGDGQLWLDPHDPDAAAAIATAVDALCRRLAALRRGLPARRERATAAVSDFPTSHATGDPGGSAP